MKKIVGLLLICLFLFFCGMRAWRFSENIAEGIVNDTGNGWSDSTDLQSGPWTGQISDDGSECFLLSWQWDGDENSMSLSIPEEIDGISVVGLGGFAFGYNEVFYIRMPEQYEVLNPYDEAWVTESDNIAADYPADYPVYQFKIKLNSKITDTAACEDNLYHSTEDGKAIAYKIEMSFE